MKFMKTLLIRSQIHGLAGLALGLAVTTLPAFMAGAHPYASGITNNSGTIQYFLNENADNVTVVFDGGGIGNTNNLGALSRGAASFSLGGHVSYMIIVSKTGTGVPSLISPVPAAGVNTNLDFNGPRGVAVNKNPKRHNFGRIYVGNASAGNHFRPVGRGIYVFNPDFSDPLGYGTNASPPQANFPSAGAQWWGGSTTYGPYRLWVGQDDTLYVADSSGSGNTAGCPVWMMDPDVTTPIEMFTYSGVTGGNSGNGGPCQTQPVITGSLGTADLVLTCMMWNYTAAGAGYQGLLRYNIGSGPIDSSTVWSGAPTIIVTNTQPGFGLGGVNGVVEDVTPNPTNSYLYVAFPRSNAGGLTNGNNSLWVFDGSVITGNTSIAAPQFVWASGSTNPGNGGTISAGVTRDCFQVANIQPVGVAVSPDGQYLATGNAAAANFCLVKLTNGIPDKSTIATYAVAGVINRSVTFDLADNLYTVEGNSDALRVYSLGFTTTCITSNDFTATNGSFQLVLPPSTASVTATTPNASQGNPTPVKGVFTITRSGQLTQPLTVGFTLAGTASNSTYTVSGSATVGNTNVTFAIGQSSTNITIIPVNDSVPRLTTTVVLNLASGTNYSASAPVTATVNIQNTATPQLILSAAAATAYKRFTNDYASVTITRLGNTNTTFTVSTLSYGGTAVQNTDYSLLSPTTIALGAVTTTAKIFSPLNPPEPSYVGSKTVIVTLGNNGSTYTNMPGSTSQTLTILDDKYPTATVLWSDTLTNNVDVNNDDGSGKWNITAVNRDGNAPDYTIDWAYDLVNDPNGYGIIPLPPSGLTNALRVTYNKVHGVSGAVNLYPTNVTFSGDYAVRFSMYAAEGGKTGAVGASKTTEGPMFGINHDGLETNWWAGSLPVVGGPWTSDGVWCWMDSDAGGATFGDYVLLTGSANAIPNAGWAKLSALFASTTTAFQNAFKNPNDFTTVGISSNAIPGIPANASAAVVSTATANWADVEIKQVKNLVTLSIDKTPIFTYTNNNSVFQSGTIMLGYEDPFDSLGDQDAAVYYSNVQVVRLGPPVITRTALSGSNVQISFISVDGDDTPASFALQSSSVVLGPYTDVSPAATITQDPATGVFTAVTAQNGPIQFYRIRHL